MEFGLRDKAVLVTGGSRGIGLEIALAFAAEGAHVAICGRDEDTLEEARAAIAAKGVRAAAVSVDLFTAEGCTRAVEFAAQELGGLDVLINNASTAIGGTLESLNDKQVMERLNGKALSAMRCARTALPHLRASGRGRVICMGGSAARAPGKGARPSGLSNAAVVNFAYQLSRDVAADGITVNVVHPSATLTDRTRAMRIETVAKALGISEAEAEAALGADFPIGRMVVPADIAPLVVFLAADQAAAITGQTIAVDGGSTPGVVY
jgi:3-oxoacyl-[acyl-carrier protein] reductase